MVTQPEDTNMQQPPNDLHRSLGQTYPTPFYLYKLKGSTVHSIRPER